jgi:hypothetical protein
VQGVQVLLRLVLQRVQVLRVLRLPLRLSPRKR